MTLHSIFIEHLSHSDTKSIQFSACDSRSKTAAAWPYRENPAVLNPKYNAEFKHDLSLCFIHSDQA